MIEVSLEFLSRLIRSLTSRVGILEGDVRSLRLEIQDVKQYVEGVKWEMNKRFDSLDNRLTQIAELLSSKKS